MIEKIYKYLIKQNRGVTNREIIYKFFYVPEHYPPEMEQILRKLLINDDRFIYTDDGKWKINKSYSKDLLVDLTFTIVEFEYYSLDRNTHIPLAVGIRQIQNSQIIASELYKVPIPTSISCQLRKQIEDFQKQFSFEKPFHIYATKIVPQIQQSILIHNRPGKILNQLNFLFRDYSDFELEIEIIHLIRLVRSIFPGIKIRSIFDVAKSLDIYYEEPLHLANRLELVTDIFFKLLEMLNLKNIESLENLKNFIEENEDAIDYSKFAFNANFIKELPRTPGIYMMKDEKDEVFYVGKAKNLNKRIGSYFVNRFETDKKNKEIFSRIYGLEYIQVGSELEALLLEHKYIKKYEPIVNKQIEIHSMNNNERVNGSIVLFLPALVNGYIMIFFVLEKNYATKISIDLTKPDWQLCRQKMNIFFNKSERKSEYSNEEIEIIQRWFIMNKESVNYIDMSLVSDIRHCMKIFRNFLADEDLLTRKISYI